MSSQGSVTQRPSSQKVSVVTALQAGMMGWTNLGSLGVV